jgi:hypothetical protein
MSVCLPSSPVLWVQATFRIDLPRRVAIALGTLCASAESSVHMLDIPLRCVLTRIAAALLQVVAMTANCFVVYHTSTCVLHPSAALGRISILLRAGNFDALAAVMTSGKNPRALSPHGYTQYIHVSYSADVRRAW